MLVGNVEVLVAHAPQAAAGGRVAAGFFALKLLAEGPVLVGNVEVIVAHTPQAAAGGRVALCSSKNAEVLVAHAPQAAAGAVWRQAILVA